MAKSACDRLGAVGARRRVRDRSTVSYDLALVTTDAAASTAQVIERYATTPPT